MPFCQYCGSEVEPEDVFCNNCGKKIIKYIQHKATYAKVIENKFSPFDEAFENLLKACALAVRSTGRAWAELEGRKPTFNDDIKELVLSCIRKQRKKIEIEPENSAEWKAYTDEKIEKLRINSAEATKYWELVETICDFG